MARSPRARADVFDRVPEASDYELLYSLEIPVTAAFNAAPVPYSIDRSDVLIDSFDRVAYYLELTPEGDAEPQFAYASMRAFADDPHRLGVPNAVGGSSYQQPVREMNVFSNVPGVATGYGFSGGNIEFWPTNYVPANEMDVPGASDVVFDAGDAQSDFGEYGSMQIHDHASGNTVIAYNNWGAGGAGDIGIGNNTVSENTGALHGDWTYRQNAGEYTSRLLQVLVRPGPRPVIVEMRAPPPRSVFQRDAADSARVPVSASILSSFPGESRVDQADVRAVPLAAHRGASTEWTTISISGDGHDLAGELSVFSGWYRLELRAWRDGEIVEERVAVEPFGVGEVFVTAGQSNSANHGAPRLEPSDERVSAGSPAGWRRAYDPQPIATGSGGSPWPALGDMLAGREDVPIGFVSVGWGGTLVEQWLPDGTLYPRLRDALGLVGPGGVRAVLWHQGESDTAARTSSADYAARLRAVIAASRRDAGYDVPWGVALVGFGPGGDPAAQADVVAGQAEVIAADPLVFEGASTDDLTGPDWRSDTIHFNEAGLREHARRWAEAIVIPTSAPTPTPSATPVPIPPRVYLPAVERN